MKKNYYTYFSQRLTDTVAYIHAITNPLPCTSDYDYNMRLDDDQVNCVSVMCGCGYTGVTQNGPDTVTFRELLPGRYDVYINVYSEDERFDGGVNVEAYLGDGLSSSLVDTLPWNLQVC